MLSSTSARIILASFAFAAIIAVKTFPPKLVGQTQTTATEAVFEGLSINVLTSDAAPTHWTGAVEGLSAFSCSKQTQNGLKLLSDSAIRADLMGAQLPDFLWNLYQKLGNVQQGSNVISDPGTLARLHFLANFLEAKMTVETGFANGASALAMLSAGDQSKTHMAMDPYQFNFRFRGLEFVQEYFQDASRNSKFIHVNESGAIGLAHLVRGHACVDLMFMDDGHKFDDNMVELYHAVRLLKIGGILVMHDAGFPSVQHAASFAVSNLGFQLILPPAEVGAYFLLKSHPDARCWYHFEAFCNASLATKLPFELGPNTPCV